MTRSCFRADPNCKYGEYRNTRTNQCVSCSTVGNSTGMTSITETCDCLTNFIWSYQSFTCVCPYWNAMTQTCSGSPLNCKPGEYRDTRTNLCVSCFLVANSIGTTKIS